MSNSKLTQKDYFNELIELARDNNREDLATFCEGRIALLNKKAENKKPSKKQEENADLKVKIAEIIATDAKTASEIVKALDIETSTQKVSALLKQMVDAKTVDRIVDKKVARFKAVTE